jgi:dethiobiotin synthetase
MKPIFITGTGTGVGKTLVAAIVTEALHGDYWKPVQAGFKDGTDSLWVSKMLTNKESVIYPEVYKFIMAASPHIASVAQKQQVQLAKILRMLPATSRPLVIEGAGGLMVPLNKTSFVVDLIKALDARVIIVSKNELGSINHSLLTAAILKKEKADVAGWIFTEEYLNYENDIARWSGYPVIGRVKHLTRLTKESIRNESQKMKAGFTKFL